MKKILIRFGFAAGTFFMASCGKNDTIVRPAQEQQGPVHSKGSRPSTLRGGGEDDDGPIVMHKVKNQANAPVQAATVMMVKGTDSLQLMTDNAGECTFSLPGYGNWQVKINHQGYQPEDTLINLSDSFSIKTSVLDQQ